MQLSSPIPDATRSKRGAYKVIEPGTLGSFILITSLFFLWGMPNNLNDVLIRQFMKSFTLSRFEAGLVQSAFYLGYFFFALPAGIFIRKRGDKAGFITGLLLFSAGCFLFYPAAYLNQYGYFLGALFVVASGLAFLETASNPFIARLGAQETSATRLNFSQAFNPLGSIVGVLIGTRYIFSGIELTSTQVASMRGAGTYAAYLQSETFRVVRPYFALGVIALCLAAIIAARHFPNIRLEQGQESRGSWKRLFSRKTFLLALVAQFLYVGAQVGTWSFFIQYAQEFGNVRERTAGLLLTFTLAAFALGRFVSASMMRRFAANRIMLCYCVTNILLLCLSLLERNWIGVIAVLATSFFMSMMFPTIFALGLKDVESNTNVASSLLVMMIIGGAVLTPLMGKVAESNIADAYVVPLVAYVGVALFAMYCDERRST